MPSETPLSASARTGVAVIGMACRVPGAASVAEFWANVCNGVESIRTVTPEELRAFGLSEEEIADPRRVPAAATIEQMECFDAGFFGVTAREAEIMDPQHRIFLECAWAALEDAGYDPFRYEGAIGVFGGGVFDSYASVNLMPNGVFDDPTSLLQAVLANEKDYLATRVSYKLNLRGPSYTVQSGCSTSLLAIHLACQNLLNYESDVALAGGVAIDVRRGEGYFYSEGSVYSRDGHCRAFDAAAQGTVFGNGVGIVVLKRLEDAVADGDSILAVIRGSATNNDGSRKVGFTAPSVTGQCAVIAEALADAGVESDTIGYVETHGTGTSLGDPIEIEAMSRAFGRTARRQYCAIGSVKCNVGHLDAAAGVSGFIKAVLALDRAKLPPSLHFTEANPKIDFPASPFFVNTTLTDWTTGTRPDLPRRAGVSSFGMGGTNVHAVLEEAPPPGASQSTRSERLVLLSAKTPDVLDDATSRLASYLQANPDTSLADAAYTLQIGRGVFAHRRAVVCRDAADAAAALVDLDPARVIARAYAGEPFQVAFLFPGQGAQRPGMGRELYGSEPVFKETVDRCCQRLRSPLGVDLRDLLYPADTSEALDAAAAKLTRTEFAQPALFVVEYALAQLWISWGIKPAACIGHSLGEYVAACLAGVMSLDDALNLIAARARLMQQAPAGAMTAVAQAWQEIEGALGSDLSIAAVNAPGLSVVSGPLAAIERFERDAKERGIEYTRLQTSHAFHSAMMDELLPAFVAEVRKTKLSAPTLPFVSNLTGTWITPSQAVDPDYWGSHLRHTVRFSEGVRALIARDSWHLLEVGPGRALSSLAKQAIADDRLAVPSLAGAAASGSATAVVLETLGRLWLRGASIDWTAVNAGESRRRIALPTYPFERTRYWVEPLVEEDTPPGPSLAKYEDLAQWFTLPEWRQTPPVQFYARGARVAADANWLLFVDPSELCDRVTEQLASQIEREQLWTVEPGDAFAAIGPRRYTVNPFRRDDYDRLFEALDSAGRLPQVVAHMWEASTQPEAEPRDDAASAERAQYRGFYSMVWLTQAWLARRGAQAAEPATLKVVTRGVQQIVGDEAIRPERATILAACRVIPQEHPEITCCCIDVAASSGGAAATQVVNELVMQAPDPVVAYRGERRWSPLYEPVRLEKDAPGRVEIRQRGTYLIVGGLGAIGLAIARHLARTASARLVLVGRSALPAPAAWTEWIGTHADTDATSARIRAVRELEALGAEVLVIAADIADRAEMAEVVAEASSRFGAIHGVIHAAGIAGAGTIQVGRSDVGSVLEPVRSIDPDRCVAQFRPKMRGLFVLEEVLDGHSPDFCLIVSSLSAVLGGLGYATYSAANCFMDAFVRRHNQQSAVRWLGANWDAWSFAAGDAGASRLTLSEQEGVEVFDRLLGAVALGQIVISVANIYARGLLPTEKAKVAKANDGEAVVEPAQTGRTVYARPAGLTDRFEPPQTPLEQTIAEIWQQVIGIDRVGRRDNFFELGGHSLLAVQVAARLEASLDLQIPMRTVFDSATVAELAAKIETVLAPWQTVPALAGADGGETEEFEL